MSGRYAMGLDFGTNSMRTLIVDARDGREIASSVSDYTGGEAGVVLDSGDPNLARQQPGEYLEAIGRGEKGAGICGEGERIFAGRGDRNRRGYHG